VGNGTYSSDIVALFLSLFCDACFLCAQGQYMNIPLAADEQSLPKNAPSAANSKAMAARACLSAAGARTGRRILIGQKALIAA
jgi:hypothetical protein